MLKDAAYHSMYRDFRWQVPHDFNLAVAVCDRHADDSNRPALIIDHQSGSARTYGFTDLKRLSSKLANLLSDQGVGFGDRIAVLLGQQVETLLCHLAAARLGAISVPLFRLFGPDALAYRLSHCAAKVLITDQAGAEKVAHIRDQLPALDRILLVDQAQPETAAFWPLLDRASDRFITVSTRADDPLFIIYTSGTTGPPKGAVHAHRVLLGHIPGVQMPHEMFPQAGDVFWTPADWAWIGGLLDVLLPSLYFGIPVVAGPAVGGSSGRFDPERACTLMARHAVRNVFFPPAALHVMRQSGVEPKRHGVGLRSIGSGGERLGDMLHDWAHSAFNVPINEFYGQTEANLVVSAMASRFARCDKAIGKAVPGHHVAIIGDDGRPVATGETGQIAVHSEPVANVPDPVMFLQYWGNGEATRAKFNGSWLITGDLGCMDDQGMITFEARDDDVINVRGYRIGPLEIEACLERHEMVSKAAVVGFDDDQGQGRIRAFIVLTDQSRVGQSQIGHSQAGHSSVDRSPAGETGGGQADWHSSLCQSLIDHVKDRLARHMAPHDIIILDKLPQTATGKLQRAKLRARTDNRETNFN